MDILKDNLEIYQSKLNELGFDYIKVIGYYRQKRSHIKLLLNDEDFNTEYLWDELKKGKVKNLILRYRLSKIGLMKYCKEKYPLDELKDVIFLEPDLKLHGKCKFISKDGREKVIILKTFFNNYKQDSIFFTQEIDKESVINSIKNIVGEKNIVKIDFSIKQYNPIVTFRYGGREFTRLYTTLKRTWLNAVSNNRYHTKENIIDSLKSKFNITNLEILKIYNVTEHGKIRCKADVRCKDNNEVVYGTDVAKMLNRGLWMGNISSNEHIVATYLKSKNIYFEKQKIFSDLRYKGLLKFDFYIPIYNTCIEVDGGQHYRPVALWGGEDNFKITKLRDELKNEYCKNNNINLIRIPYWKLRNPKNLDIYFQDIVSSN